MCKKLKQQEVLSALPEEQAKKLQAKRLLKMFGKDEEKTLEELQTEIRDNVRYVNADRRGYMQVMPRPGHPRQIVCLETKVFLKYPNDTEMKNTVINVSDTPYFD